VVRYAVRPRAPAAGAGGAPDFVNQWVSWGAGLRAAQYPGAGRKARALAGGQSARSHEDIRALVHATFRHRILINYRAEAEGVNVERVIDRLLEHVKEPSSDLRRRAAERIGAPHRSSSIFIDPHDADADQEPPASRAHRRPGFLQRPASQPHHGFSVEFSEYRQYSPGMIRATSTGGCSPAATAITSSVRGRDQPALPPAGGLSQSMGSGRSRTPSGLRADRRGDARTSSLDAARCGGAGDVSIRRFRLSAGAVSAGICTGYAALERAVGGHRRICAPLEQVAATVRKRGLVC
jgi:hypothetical protein